MPKLFLHVAFLALCIISTNIQANEGFSANDHAQSSTSANEKPHGGYLKVGYGYKYEKGPYEDKTSNGSLFVSGRYQTELGLLLRRPMALMN